MKRIEIASALRCQTEKGFLFSLFFPPKREFILIISWIALIRSQMRYSGVFLQILLLTVFMWSTLILQITGNHNVIINNKYYCFLNHYG